MDVAEHLKSDEMIVRKSEKRDEISEFGHFQAPKCALTYNQIEPAWIVIWNYVNLIFIATINSTFS